MIIFTILTTFTAGMPYHFVVMNTGHVAHQFLMIPNGTTFDLISKRVKTVLLLFQEGLSCQPCGDQIKDMESNIGQFRALGIDTVVSITTDPLDALKQKVVDYRIEHPYMVGIVTVT